jgi:hypothetical protein
MARTHVPLTVTVSSEHGDTVYRLTSPTGRVLVITATQLVGALYGADALAARGGRLVLPLSTVAALSRIGSVLEPPTTPREEPTP